MRSEILYYLTLVAKMRPFGPEEFVLKHGGFFPHIPLPHGLRYGKQKLCYMNAFRLATTYPEKYLYCEGWAMGVIPVEHAWVIDSEGNCIDPTWKDKNLEYFGVAFNHSYIAKVAFRSEHYGILFNMYDNYRLIRGLDTPEEALIKEGLNSE